jgi:transposase
MYLTFIKEIDMEELADKMVSDLDFNGIEQFIINLDKRCEDWGVTVNLARHFAQLYQRYLDEVVEKECPDCGKKTHIVDNDVDGHYVACDECEWCEPI